MSSDLVLTRLSLFPSATWGMKGVGTVCVLLLAAAVNKSASGKNYSNVILRKPTDVCHLQSSHVFCKRRL